MPTALLCTDEFGPLARAESQVLGIGALPLIGVPHPLADNARTLVTAKARGIVEEIECALTATSEALQARYINKFLHLAERRLERGAICVDEVCALDPVALPARAITISHGSNNISGPGHAR